ncbi:MAG: pilus assembly protein PilP [Nitrosomonas sp.]|nr:MAG: pilus assembly protein PilP [Nitrosomonas sp.]
MIKKIILLILAADALIMLTACGQSGYHDLEAFVQSSGEGLQGKVDPLPEMKHYKSFAYAAFDLPEPFAPRKNDMVQAVSNGIQPDLTRRKEALEAHPLESLAMVGSLQQNDMTYALIKSPDGILYRVRTGNYLGQNFGKISHISESEVKLLEIVQDGVNDWVERTSALILRN